MTRAVRMLLILAILIGSMIVVSPAGASAPASPAAPCTTTTVPATGAKVLSCVPASGWNGYLVVYAHGYTAFNEPIDFYNLQLDDGTYLPDLAMSLGFAFAATSYQRNGLAIVEGVTDVRDAVTTFQQVTQLTPTATFIAGPSEGGIVAALSMERSADIFDAGLSLCGPVGDFRKQIDYWGDFRVLFDYFFRNALPPNAMNIPSYVIDNWATMYEPAIDQRVNNNPAAAAQLIKTSKAAIDTLVPSSVNETVLNLLWYSVFATNDGKAQLGGVPFDNRRRIYWGSANDLLLNQRVQRFAADPAALAAMGAYNTSGNIGGPLVLMHTTGDEIIPFWHQAFYGAKLALNADALYLQIPIPRYGHCAFTAEEMIVGFQLMVLMGTGLELTSVPAQYDVAPVRARMEQAAEEFSAQSMQQ